MLLQIMHCQGPTGRWGRGAGSGGLHKEDSKQLHVKDRSRMSQRRKLSIFVNSVECGHGLAKKVHYATVTAGYQMLQSYMLLD